MDLISAFPYKEDDTDSSDEGLLSQAKKEKLDKRSANEKGRKKKTWQQNVGLSLSTLITLVFIPTRLNYWSGARLIREHIWGKLKSKPTNSWHILTTPVRPKSTRVRMKVKKVERAKGSARKKRERGAGVVEHFPICWLHKELNKFWYGLSTLR